jgi:hypothetical protein
MGMRWQPGLAESLGLQCELRAVFDREPASFSATKLVTLRLLGRDLKLDA